VVVAEQLHDFLGVGLLREGGEPPEIAEEHRDLAPVRGQHRLVAGRQELGELRREEALEPLGTFELGAHPLAVAQAGEHHVERGAELAQLVAPRHGDRRTEIAGGHIPRRAHQCLHGMAHPPCDDDRPEERQQQARGPDREQGAEEARGRPERLGQGPLEHDEDLVADRFDANHVRLAAQVDDAGLADRRQSSLELVPVGAVEGGRMHGEVAPLTVEEGDVQPRQAPQVGRGAVVDGESCADPGDRDGRQQRHDGQLVESAVHHDDARGLARLLRVLQEAWERERRAEPARHARIGAHGTLGRHEHQHIGFDPLPMVLEDGACGRLVRRRGGRLQREVARQQPGGRDELLAARLELPHEQGAGEPQLFTDLVTRARTHGGRDDEEARRLDDREQPDEDDDEPPAEATKATEAHRPILPRRNKPPASEETCHTEPVWTWHWFIVDPSFTRPRLWRSLPRTRECRQPREISQRWVMAQKLFIGGLSFSTSNERLREVFAQAGVVESAAVVTDRETGRSRGFGFVEMATADEADAAVKKFNGQELDGRTLKVELAKPAGLGGGARSGGGSRSGGGFSRSRW